MKGNKNKTESFMLPGQLTLWDIEITEKPKNVTENPILDTKITEKNLETGVLYTELSIVNKTEKNEKPSKPLELTDKQRDFITKNDYFKNENLSRIIKYCGGGVGIELLHGEGYKTIYVNAEGKEEFTFVKKIPILPMDETVYYKDSEVRFTKIQEEKFKELQSSTPGAKVINRKGDDNIILEYADKVVSINLQGWVLEFNGCKAVYEDDEVLQDPVDEPVDLAEMQKSIKLGDIVEAQHGERTITGEIVHIYGPGNVTLNIAFDNYTKQTAVPRGRVIKILKCA